MALFPTACPGTSPRMDADIPFADTPFDRRLRRLRRDRAEARFSEANYLHRLMADELLDRLSLVKRNFADALVLGCADGDLSQRLMSLGLDVTSVDAGFRFASACSGGGVQCDEDRPAFADASFDLVVSAGVLDNVNDLPGALVLARKMLRPDGLLLAAFVGAGSLPRLRAAMMAADAATGGAAPHIHPQIDVRAAGDLLTRAGFALPVADSTSLTVRFPDLATLVHDLRAAAATNILAARARRPILRVALAAAEAEFARHAEADGKIPEQVEIIHLTAWAPSPDQPKPARRGSGTTSLAAVLRKPS
ncbi:MAG: SAM-dependent methyltransferase [Alphaproteobacteria bacterium]|nr:SAM-dependent methyltransferase [Alphaproteobacteria bacterium]